MVVEERCRLCGVTAQLRESHVIPAFVIRWLKETSGTRYLATVANPNRRLQDLPRRRLLCPICERRVGDGETLFAQRLFHRYHSGNTSFPYDRWLATFAVSLAWRTAVVTGPEVLPRWPQYVDAMNEAIEAWAEFLLGVRQDTKPYRHNLFFNPEGMESTFLVPSKTPWYLLRAVDATVVMSPRGMAVYTRLPGMFFWSSVLPPDPGGWKRTKISRHGTLGVRDQRIEEPGVGEFILGRIQAVQDSMSEVSANKARSNAKSVLKDPVRTVRSLSTRAHLEEQRLSKGPKR